MTDRSNRAHLVHSSTPRVFLTATDSVGLLSGGWGGAMKERVGMGDEDQDWWDRCEDQDWISGQ